MSIKCEACGVLSNKFTKVLTTNGALNFCDQCLDDINRKNPELARLRAENEAAVSEVHRLNAENERLQTEVIGWKSGWEQANQSNKQFLDCIEGQAKDNETLKARIAAKDAALAEAERFLIFWQGPHTDPTERQRVADKAREARNLK